MQKIDPGTREQMVHIGAGGHGIPAGMFHEVDKMTQLPEVLEYIESRVTFLAETLEKKWAVGV